MTPPVFRSVENDLPGKDFVAQEFRDGAGNLRRPGVVTVDHHCLERDGMREGLPGRGLIERRLCAEGVTIELAHGHGPFIKCIYTS